METVPRDTAAGHRYPQDDTGCAPPRQGGITHDERNGEMNGEVWKKRVTVLVM